MAVMHFKHDFNATVEPLCKKVPAAIAQGTLRIENVTCKSCLKILVEAKTIQMFGKRAQ